ncbi:hypothetical protein NOJ05_30440 [Neorhizobium galegae]|uniref:hypothetical protein n=1 Tax=Neorhizobium galegae TaxID=399 RepID=UPI00210846F7|nr:hypothetical protein [Neorhizobium galegae]MCQ1781514.1 hypothetical protein [Neorhizobium galegae]MCQ1798490.1 hypothetical protein [Neorhizobium galegae]
MLIRKMLFVSGALTAIVATVLPLKVVAGADGMLRVALSSVAAQEGNGNGGGGSNGGNGGENGNGGSGGNGNGNGGGNAGGDSGNSGNGNGNSGGNGNGNAGGADNGTGGSGTGAGAGSASAGGAANPGRAPATPAQPATPAAPAKAGVEVDVRGSSITVRHQNGATERISQGRYEMRDSRSRTIVNRTATPSDASRLRSFGR